MRHALLGLSFFVVVGCSSEAKEPEQPTVASMPAMPDAECGRGTMTTLGEGECTPVGVEACPKGFARTEDGYGCSAIKTADLCTGDARAKIGNASCVTVGDCDSYFPPSKNVFAVVYDSQELASAIERAQSGDTIALQDGTYDGVEIKDKDLKLVGRCPGKTIIGGTGLRGVLAQGKAHVSIEGVTIRGPKGALVSVHGAMLDVTKTVITDVLYGLTVENARIDISDSVIEGRSGGQGQGGLIAKNDGEIVVRDSELRDWDAAARALDRGKITFERSVISDAGHKRGLTKLLGVYSDGRITVKESGVYAFHPQTVFAQVSRSLEGIVKDENAPAGTVRFENSELAKPDFEDPSWLVGAHQGGRLEVEGTTIRHRADTAFDIRDPETRATFKGSAIISAAREGVIHNGIATLAGAHSEVESVAFVSPSSTACFVGDEGSELRFTRSLVTKMKSGSEASAIVSDRASSVIIEASSFTEGRGWAVLGNAGSRVQIDRTLFDGSGVLVGGTATLAMSDSVVRHAPEALIAVFGRGVVTDSFIVDNEIAVHLDYKSTLLETNGEPPIPADGQLILVRTQLAGNKEKISEKPTHLYKEEAPSL